jgi:hypothetical protein
MSCGDRISPPTPLALLSINIVSRQTRFLYRQLAATL